MFVRDSRSSNDCARETGVSVADPIGDRDARVAESFFATLEVELLMQNDWHTREDARRAILRYLESQFLSLTRPSNRVKSTTSCDASMGYASAAKL
jgi:hypothetical protein